MDRKTIVLIAALVGVSCVTNTRNCTAPEIESIKGCYGDFISAYGFDRTNLLPKYLDFDNKRNTWLVNGLAKQPQIKKIGAALTDCMKPYTECVGADIYSGNFNQTPDDAKKYLTDLAVTGYQSSDRGYNLLLKHKYCMDKCTTSQAANLTQCTTDANDFKDVNDCNKYIICVHEVYTGICGQEAGEYECGVSRADINISQEKCVGMNKCIPAL